MNLATMFDTVWRTNNYDSRYTMSNLIGEFAREGVDQSELELLFQVHFGRASSSGSKEVHLSHDGDTVALSLHYKDGELREVHAGPGLRENDVQLLKDKIETALLASEGKVIAQVPLFAGLPTSGHYRYQNQFQLVPVPAEAPRPISTNADHPLLLQYEVANCSDWQIVLLRRERVGRELELLCSALTMDIKGSLGATGQFRWCLTSEQLNSPVGVRSEYCQELYTYPGQNGTIASYTATDDAPPLKRVPAAKYYGRYGITAGSTLDIPDTFDACLDAYFSLPRELKDKFMRAAYWFQYARRCANMSRSGSFTALVSAVEVLLPDVPSEGVCKECAREFNVGPTKKFVRFVEQYAPEPSVTKTQRRDLYSLRSALSHGGKLLHSDMYSWGGALTPTQARQWFDERALWMTVRLVLVNWLLQAAP